MQRALAVPAVALASVLALAGCSTITQQPSEGREQAGGVDTGVGVTRSGITLGALTDHSGPFAALGLGVVQGNQIWIDETNADGGICGRKIELKIRDHGYNASTAKTQYSELAPTVLGFMHVLGSPVTAALARSCSTTRPPWWRCHSRQSSWTTRMWSSRAPPSTSR
jgi:ABC-type branched-subunit amino acid transport system substrate-binding protein